jgi:2,4-dienoyl-CoA reductase-like NADH-dependent reductase (Old Yellow Enzyme family)
MTQHPTLTSPLQLRGHTLRNRIVFGAHTNNMSDRGSRAAAGKISCGTRLGRGGDGGLRTRAGASDRAC